MQTESTTGRKSIRNGGERRQGRGQGSGRRKAGRTGGRGAVAMCVCTQCGSERPHRRGTPCRQAACDRCGGLMVPRSERSANNES
jgi:hypothetical protein